MSEIRGLLDLAVFVLDLERRHDALGETRVLNPRGVRRVTHATEDQLHFTGAADVAILA